MLRISIYQNKLDLVPVSGTYDMKAMERDFVERVEAAVEKVYADPDVLVDASVGAGTSFITCDDVDGYHVTGHTARIRRIVNEVYEATAWGDFAKEVKP